MKKSTAFIFIWASLACLTVQSQNVNRCATHDVYEYNAHKNPGYAAAVEHAFNAAKQSAQRIQANKSGDWDTIYRIPIVVHIVYNTPEQNLDDSLICSQIEVLNQDYRRLNADTSSTRSFFKSRAADTGIEFFLATTDPQGNPTTGITRTYTDTPYFSVIGDIFSGSSENGADKVKKTAKGGIDAWDVNNYLNIWVCNMKDPASIFGLVLGFAYPPDNAPNWPAEAFPADSTLSGVVIHYEVFGRNNPLATGQLEMANQGRSAVHEVGHYLGLRHIWGDGPLSILIPDCSVDDGIDDTPNSGNNSQADAASAVNCNINKNTCTDSINDLPDMWENYMDYSKEECQNMFTQGQAAIMRAMLATSRTDLAVLQAPASHPICSPSVSAESPMADASISVYPNPSTGNFSVAISSPVKKIAVSDIFGKQMDFNLNEMNPGKFAITTAGFPKGIYCIHIETQSSMFIRKIMIQ